MVGGKYLPVCCDCALCDRAPSEELGEFASSGFGLLDDACCSNKPVPPGVVPPGRWREFWPWRSEVGEEKDSRSFTFDWTLESKRLRLVSVPCSYGKRDAMRFSTACALVLMNPGRFITSSAAFVGSTTLYTTTAEMTSGFPFMSATFTLGNSTLVVFRVTICWSLPHGFMKYSPGVWKAWKKRPYTVVTTACFGYTVTQLVSAGRQKNGLPRTHKTEDKTPPEKQTHG